MHFYMLLQMLMLPAATYRYGNLALVRCSHLPLKYEYRDSVAPGIISIAYEQELSKCSSAA